MNGELVDWADAKVHVGAHGLHYGSGVFEGIRCYDTTKGPAIFRLGDHMERLLASARVYGLAVPYTAAELCAAAVRTVARNEVRAAYIRPLVFFGEGPIHLTPS